MSTYHRDIPMSHAFTVSIAKPKNVTDIKQMDRRNAYRVLHVHRKMKAKGNRAKCRCNWAVQ